MKIWKHTPLDSTLCALSVGQFVATIFLASNWDNSSLIARLGGYALLVFMMVYNIIVVSHLFTHTAWFESQFLNALASLLNSINSGQSVQAYQFTHVRNHHRYNNDRKGPDGKTKDLSSTFRDGSGDNPSPLGRYAFLGAASTLRSLVSVLLSVFRLFRVTERERDLLILAGSSQRRGKELRQVQLDRMSNFLAVSLFLAISWKWTLLCYLPALFFAFVLVNIQNYYEHYGAVPEDRYADSVSYYGVIYNLLTFNDGYHQEHHLGPHAHWSTMPELRRKYSNRLDNVERIVSPTPAVIGFFHRSRKQLSRPRAASANAGAERIG